MCSTKGSTLRPLSHLEVPADFPVQPYLAVHQTVTTLYPESEAWTEFSAAWTALAYRYRACAGHDNTFSHSIRKAGDTPPHPQRYIQDQALFEFFVNGLAAIESVCYGCFALGHLLAPSNFLFSSETERRRVTPERARDSFTQAFPTSSLTRALSALCASTEYSEWCRARNVLTHRVSPGRIIYASVGSRSADPPPVMKTLQITLDSTTTSSRRSWLAATLRSLLTAVASLLP